MQFASLTPSHYWECNVSRMADHLMSVSLLILSILLPAQVDAQSKAFIDPDRQSCERREPKKNKKVSNCKLHCSIIAGSIHYRNFGKSYHMSWLAVDSRIAARGVDRKFTWVQARNYCRRFCMDAVSFDTRAEYDAIARIIEDGNK